jgi:hypothetical protein
MAMFATLVNVNNVDVTRTDGCNLWVCSVKPLFIVSEKTHNTVWAELDIRVIQ